MANSKEMCLTSSTLRGMQMRYSFINIVLSVKCCSRLKAHLRPTRQASSESVPSKSFIERHVSHFFIALLRSQRRCKVHRCHPDHRLTFSVLSLEIRRMASFKVRRKLPELQIIGASANGDSQPLRFEEIHSSAASEAAPSSKRTRRSELKRRRQVGVSGEGRTRSTKIRLSQ